ncbi:hypothetical protein RchiOBHm_Chr1g0329971 [Rosa chinensis]|uniref:Uncharacterized protein n=1 Tax=Rosa chinensis TaxID=74649 RepID=A0A2P6SB52_ROSCH|nr:hypothetical protein RchiOBHm_Chr1g0329971 [Rosa chinensis]
MSVLVCRRRRVILTVNETSPSLYQLWRWLSWRKIPLSWRVRFVDLHWPCGSFCCDACCGVHHNGLRRQSGMMVACMVLYE